MDFRITGLEPHAFSHLVERTTDELATFGVTRHRVDAIPAFPDRNTLADLAIGETALLLNFVHQPANTAYRASHAIFIGERGVERFDAINAIPPALRVRLLSLRAFDASGTMRDADVVDGAEAETLVRRLFANPAVAYIQAHFAKRGCFAATIERA